MNEDMNRTWIATWRKNGKWLFDLIASEKIKRNVLQALPFWVASLTVGVVSVGYAWLFAQAERLMLHLLASTQWVIFLLTPNCFVMSWWIIHYFAQNARGSGIPQFMAAIDLSSSGKEPRLGRLLSLKIIIVKIFSSLLMVLGGGAVGREGPTIQIAGSIFYTINKHIPSSWPKLSKQSYLLTGAAAGLAAAFNTPLGGMVFAMEELAKIHVRFFRTALFVAVIIAGLTAQGLMGPYLYLGYPDVSHLSLYIFFAVIITAIFAGWCGAAMSKMIIAILRWRKTIKGVGKTIAVICVIGVLVAVVARWIDPEVVGSGKELMNERLFTAHKEVAWYTAILRILGPVASFGTGAAGGIFAPALAAGAGIGGFAADLFHYIGANANILILVGMVGFLTGVTQTPFTSAILVLEMTDRHNVIFHLMLAAVFAYGAALTIDRHSLYDRLKNDYLHVKPLVH
jgi:H+/Cl- antiporter ClcA